MSFGHELPREVLIAREEDRALVASVLTTAQAGIEMARRVYENIEGVGNGERDATAAHFMVGTPTSRALNPSEEVHYIAYTGVCERLGIPPEQTLPVGNDGMSRFTTRVQDVGQVAVTLGCYVADTIPGVSLNHPAISSSLPLVPAFRSIEARRML
jgi:hypothetical protein